MSIFVWIFFGTFLVTFVIKVSKPSPVCPQGSCPTRPRMKPQPFCDAYSLLKLAVKEFGASWYKVVGTNSSFNTLTAVEALTPLPQGRGVKAPQNSECQLTCVTRGPAPSMRISSYHLSMMRIIC